MGSDRTIAAVVVARVKAAFVKLLRADRVPDKDERGALHLGADGGFQRCKGRPDDPLVRPAGAPYHCDGAIRTIVRVSSATTRSST